MSWKRRLYLDSAAGMAGNPSSPHEDGRKAKEMLEAARLAIARLVEVQKDDVLFTSGATEANAIAILGHVRALRLLAGPDAVGRNNIHVLYLPSAHASIVENIRILASEGVTVEPLPIKDYRIDTEVLSSMIRPETALVTMDAVCGETGVVWNTREVADVLKKSRNGEAAAEVLLHVDASQAPLTEKFSRAHFDADMLTFDVSKVAAIRGIGALIAHRTIPLVPLYGGGGQERGLRSGSESPLLALAFANALGKAATEREAFRAQAELSRVQLIERIKKGVTDVYIHEGRQQAPQILNISLIGRDTDYVVALLDEAGFAVSTRSACETDSETGSRAIHALTGSTEEARSTLRISWDQSISTRALLRFARALIRAIAFVDKGSRG